MLARVLTFGDSGREFPESADDVPAFCNETKVLVKTVDTYVKKCTKGLSKQLFSVYVFTIKSQLTQLCKRDSRRRREMMSAAKCVNAAKQVFAKCVDRTVDRLQRIRLLDDDSKKIPHLCCEYHANKHCNTDGGKHVSGCTDRDLDTVEKLADTVAGNSMNLVCGEFADTSDKCQSLDKLPKNVKKPQKFKSFFIPAIDIIRSLKA